MISRRAFVTTMTAARRRLLRRHRRPHHPRSTRVETAQTSSSSCRISSKAPPYFPAILVSANLDRFGQEGLIFSRAYCPAPHCCPSRATFMTGLYPSEHGVFNNVDTDTAIHFDPYPGTRYFSQSLEDAGYALGYSGKWHSLRGTLAKGDRSTGPRT
jgi:hypothetical protein